MKWISSLISTVRACMLVLVSHDTEVAERTRRIIRVCDGRIVEDQPSAKA